jgi:hypothetical protein
MRAPPVATWDALAAARTDLPTPLSGLPTSAVLSAPSTLWQNRPEPLLMALSDGVMRHGS